ncbi:hypothetical protein N7507_007038 [Penicillium longicatenatum]|nr:hypothetical protein N7507_007038 [Penicillium longicatenatum]
MKFTSTVAILAVAAGVQAAKRAEPPVHERVARSGAAGTGTAVKTGTHPIMTGSPVHNGTTNGTVPTSSAGHGSSIAVIPSSTRSAGAGSGTGSGSGAGSSNTPASPSSTGFNPTNAGANVHPMGVAGAMVGGAVYGLMLL